MRNKIIKGKVFRGKLIKAKLSSKKPNTTLARPLYNKFNRLKKAVDKKF